MAYLSHHWYTMASHYLALLSTLFASIFCICVVKHLWLDALSWHAHKTYHQLFSTKSAQTLTNQWCHLDRSRVATVGSFTQAQNQGTDLCLYTYSDTGKVKNIIYAQRFTNIGTLFYASSADQWHAHNGRQTILHPLPLAFLLLRSFLQQSNNNAVCLMRCLPGGIPILAIPPLQNNFVWIFLSRVNRFCL